MTSSGPTSPRCPASIRAPWSGSRARRPDRGPWSACGRSKRSRRRARRPGRGSPPGSESRRPSWSRSRRRSTRSSRRSSSSRRRAFPRTPRPDPAARGLPEPEFYQRQSLRLSTAMTPRVIACAEDLPSTWAYERVPERSRGAPPRARGSSRSRTNGSAGSRSGSDSGGR